MRHLHILMRKQICKNSKAAAAVEIPVLQRAPLACFIYIIMLYREIPDIFQAIKTESQILFWKRPWEKFQSNF